MQTSEPNRDGQATVNTGRPEGERDHGAATVAPRQAGPHVWTSDQIAGASEEWSWQLNDVEIEELLTASAALADGDPDLSLFTAQEFPLPATGPRLEKLRSQLIAGRGFGVIQGWPIGDVSVRQSAAAFMGIGAHLGSARSQNAAGHLLGHIRDLGMDADDPAVRIYQTNARQTFHTDSSDAVALLCLETAESGGRSLIVSAATVYNEMLDQAPELAALLFEPVATDRRGE
ncbi:MAG: TauD/TfdA family dioxygenase, partial [Actinomycetia bacterium]|nr:TauD/TfdA family dioxygenase [Actinomycetes bacterium]